MAVHQKIKAWTITALGFILSPVSWWNDIVVNIPLAYLFAVPFGIINKQFFLPAFILGYWLTNILGFILLHHGIRQIFLERKEKSFKKELWKNIVISLIYTVMIIFCIKMGWFKFLPDYIDKL